MKSRTIDGDISVHMVESPIDDHPMPTIIMKINMPFMYARRVLVNTHYTVNEGRTGKISTVSSSLLNEQIRDDAKNKKDEVTSPVINDEVVAFNHINYIRVETRDRE